MKTFPVLALLLIAAVLSPAQAMIVLAACTLAQAQEKDCTSVEVSMNAILQDGRVLRGMHREDIVAQAKNENLEILSVENDKSPRRIVFLLDNGRDMSADARKAQAEIVKYILSEGRPEDTFGLITARGPHVEIRFEEAREKIAAELDQAMNERREKGPYPGVLDSLMQAIGWFQTPRMGDSIIAMASEIETNQSVRYPAVVEGPRGTPNQTLHVHARK